MTGAGSAMRTATLIVGGAVAFIAGVILVGPSKGCDVPVEGGAPTTCTSAAGITMPMPWMWVAALTTAVGLAVVALTLLRRTLPRSAPPP